MGRGKSKNSRRPRKDRRHAENLQAPVPDFPPLPPRTSSSSTAPWGPWRGPAKINHLTTSIYMHFSPSDREQYHKSFAANKAERKEARLDKKWTKVENERIKRESGIKSVFETSTSSQNGLGMMGNMHAPPNIKEDTKPLHLNFESTGEMIIKPELNDDDEEPDLSYKKMTDAQYLAEFRHNESDMHLRALLWKKHTGLYRMPARGPA